MSETVLVEYDGVFATLKEFDPKVEDLLSECLRYQDSSIELMNKKNPNFQQNPTIKLYSRKKHQFLTGLLPRVSSILTNEGYHLIPRPKIDTTPSVTVDLDTFNPFSEKSLWEHQKDAVRFALKSKRCVIQLPTGSGKTVVLATLIKHFPQAKIIITSPDVSIMKNNAKTIEMIIGEEVGIVGGGKKDYQRVTSCTLDTLYLDLKKDPTFLQDVEIALADECHSVGNTKMNNLIFESMPKTFMRVGVSATAWRESGDNLAMEGYLGPKVFEVKEEELQKAGILVKFDYFTVPIKDKPTVRYNNFNPKTGQYNTYNNKPVREEVYREMIVKNKERNDIIIDLCKDYINLGCPLGPGLILSESIDHSEDLYTELCRFLREGEDIEYIKGQTSKRKREEVITKLRNRELKFAVSTRVFNVGVDFPAVAFLIIASGGNAQSRLIQQLGRVIRKAENKDKAIVIDFKDTERYYLARNFYNRTKALKDRYPSTQIITANSGEIKNAIRS